MPSLAAHPGNTFHRHTADQPVQIPRTLQQAEDQFEDQSPTSSLTSSFSLPFRASQSLEAGAGSPTSFRSQDLVQLGDDGEILLQQRRHTRTVVRNATGRAVLAPKSRATVGWSKVSKPAQAVQNGKIAEGRKVEGVVIESTIVVKTDLETIEEDTVKSAGSPKTKDLSYTARTCMAFAEEIGEDTELGDILEESFAKFDNKLTQKERARFNAGCMTLRNTNQNNHNIPQGNSNTVRLGKRGRNPQSLEKDPGNQEEKLRHSVEAEDKRIRVNNMCARRIQAAIEKEAAFMKRKPVGRLPGLGLYVPAKMDIFKD